MESIFDRGQTEDVRKRLFFNILEILTKEGLLDEEEKNRIKMLDNNSYEKSC